MLFRSNVIPPEPFVNVAPVTVPDAVTLVAPLIAPVFVIPPSVLSIDLVTTSPSASTLNPVIVIVPIVKSPEPSIDVAPLMAPDDRVNVPSVIDELTAKLFKMTFKIHKVEGTHFKIPKNLIQVFVKTQK